MWSAFASAEMRWETLGNWLNVLTSAFYCVTDWSAVSSVFDENSNLSNAFYVLAASLVVIDCLFYWRAFEHSIDEDDEEASSSHLGECARFRGRLMQSFNTLAAIIYTVTAVIPFEWDGWDSWKTTRACELWATILFFAASCILQYDTWQSQNTETDKSFWKGYDMYFWAGIMDLCGASLYIVQSTYGLLLFEKLDSDCEASKHCLRVYATILRDSSYKNMRLVGVHGDYFYLLECWCLLVASAIDNQPDDEELLAVKKKSNSPSPKLPASEEPQRDIATKHGDPDDTNEEESDSFVVADLTKRSPSSTVDRSPRSYTPVRTPPGGRRQSAKQVVASERRVATRNRENDDPADASSEPAGRRRSVREAELLTHSDSDEDPAAFVGPGSLDASDNDSSGMTRSRSSSGRRLGARRVSGSGLAVNTNPKRRQKPKRKLTVDLSRSPSSNPSSLTQDISNNAHERQALSTSPMISSEYLSTDRRVAINQVHRARTDLRFEESLLDSSHQDDQA